MSTSAPAAPPSLPLILRKDDHLVLSAFSETDRTLTEWASSRCVGDYRECEVCFHPTEPNTFAHANTTHVRYSAVRAGADGDPAGWELVHRFELEERAVVALAFSPRGTLLLTYAMMDSKRPEGNMAVYEVATGKLVRRCGQARWPGVLWTMDEAFCVRHVQGCLHVTDGEMRRGEHAALAKLELQLPQEKEIELSIAPGGVPFLALFKPFHKQTPGTLFVYRLPHLQEGALYQASFGRAESASVVWSHSGQHMALLVKTESDKSGKSYYGTVVLFLVDVQARGMKEIKFPAGESVHDCQWNPTREELMVVHGSMPRNKTTLYDKTGVALMTFGEAPRNLILWAPNGRFCALGGTGNLAGDFVFFDLQPPSNGKAGGVTPSGRPLAVTTGEFNEKSSIQTWAPDSHVFLCATIFTRLRIDNKVVFFKNNGERLCTHKFPLLYGAHFVRMHETEAYPIRPASPRAVSAAPSKPQAYRPPGGTSAAAAMLRKTTDTSTAKEVKPVGPVGGTVVVQKKKRKR